MQTQKQNNTAIVATERTLGKKLPCAVEAEKALLGALLLNDEQVSQVLEIIGFQDFYLPSHVMIFEAIAAIAGRMERIDIITLQNELDKKNALEAIGGIMYLMAL